MNKAIKITDILDNDEINRYLPDLNKDHYYSRYIELNTLSIFTFRELRIVDESLETFSNHYFFKNGAVYLYQTGVRDLIQLDDGYKEILKYLQETHLKNTEIIDAYFNQVEELEDLIYDQKLPRHYIEMWFDIKKSVSKIERYLSKTIKAIEDFAKSQNSYIANSGRDLEHLKEKIHNSSAQIISLVSKLDTIYNYYTSVKNDRLNKNIYLLTLLSGIFLPLNLIVGFFGMNTENLFFKDHPKGTIYVFSILIGVLFFFTIGFKLFQVIDGLLLKYGLGKYKFYQVVSKKLQKIENVMDTD